MKTPFILLAGLCLLWSSCRHDLPTPTIPEPDPCTPCDVELKDEIYSYSATGQCMFFCQNPSNPDEVLLVYTDDTRTGYPIYSLSQKKILRWLAVPKIWEKPKWSAKNWIVYGYGGQLFKIKGNNDSLQQLTFSKTYYNPEWSPDGTKIITYYGAFVAVLDEHGTVLDTTAEPLAGQYDSFGAWGTHNLIASSPTGYRNKLTFWAYPDLRFVKSITVNPDEDYDVISGSWIPHTKSLVWLGNYDGIYQTDYEAGTTTCVRKSCANKTRYGGLLQVSPDGKYIYTTKTIYNVDTVRKKIQITPQFCRLNIDGTQEVIYPVKP